MDVGATSEDLTSIDTVDEDEVDDARLSLGDRSLITCHFFFPLESCDEGWRGSAPPDDISIHRKIMLQIINRIEC